MSPRTGWVLALAFLATCGGEKPALAPALEPAGSYSWRPGRTVPCPAGLALDAIPFGPLGRTATTRLYLTCDGALTDECASQGGTWGTGVPAPAAGRYGRGLRLDTVEARFALGPCGPQGRQWTIECWLRPEALGAGPLFTLTGLLAVRSDETGLVVARTPGDPKDSESLPRPTFVRSPVPLRAGEWNHLAVVLDLRDTRSLRVVVNGEARGKRLITAFEPPEALELALGAGSGSIPACALDELRLQARAANTEEFQAAMAGPAPLEHLTREGPDGRRKEQEIWCSVLRQPRLDTPEAWQRGELERVVASAEGLRRVDGNWRKIDACDPPVARTTQATAFLGRHRIVMFGGETRDSHAPPMSNTDDTWIFDTQAETWERLELPLAPRGRCHQDSAYSPEHDVALLFGGFEFIDDEPICFSDTWLFHGAEQRWEDCGPEVRTRGTSDDGVVWHPRARRFVVLTGRGVRTFDPGQRIWSERSAAQVVDERGRELGYRPAGSMMACYDPDSGLIVLFGGSRDAHDDSQYVDDTYLYDFEANRLTRLEPEVKPSPRVRGGFGWDPLGKRVVLFGGVRSQRSERMGDLWTFDVPTRRWTPREAANGPSPRGGYYGMEFDPELGRFFLLCGRNSHERFLGEAWTLSLDDRAPGRARYVFDRSAFSAERTWFAECETPGDARVELHFRASPDCLQWTDWADSAPAEGRFLQVETTLWPGAKAEVPRVRAMGFRAR